MKKQGQIKQIIYLQAEMILFSYISYQNQSKYDYFI